MSDTFRVGRWFCSVCVIVCALTGVSPAFAAPPIQRLVGGLMGPLAGSCQPGTLTLRTSRPGNLEETHIDVSCAAEGTRQFLQVNEPGRYRGAMLTREGHHVWQTQPGGHTRRLTPAGLRRPWLGSDFTIADILGLDPSSHDYAGVATFSGEHEGVEVTALSLTASSDQAAWGKIEALVRVGDGAPQHMRFYDRDGVLVRRQLFSTIAALPGSSGPCAMRRMVPEESAAAGFSELIWQVGRVSPAPAPRLASNAHRHRP